MRIIFDSCAGANSSNRQRRDPSAVELSHPQVTRKGVLLGSVMFGPNLRCGDVVTVEVDTRRKSVSFYRNQASEGVMLGRDLVDLLVRTMAGLWAVDPEAHSGRTCLWRLASQARPRSSWIRASEV